MRRKITLRGNDLLAASVRLFQTSQPMTRRQFADAIGVHNSAGCNLVDDLAATGWIVCTFEHDRIADRFGCASRFSGHVPKYIEARILARQFRALYDTLESGPYTVAELVKASGRDASCVRRAVRAMHANRIIHVCGWEPPSGSGKSSRVFAAGFGVDAKPPAKVGRVTTQKKYNDRRAHMRLLARMAGQSIEARA